MNATFRFAVKSCLLTAVSGVLLNQVVGFAQDSGDSSGPIRRTATYQDTASSSGQQPTSEVQKQLQELYRKNGREMPSMNMEDLPNTQPPAMPPSGNGQVAPSAANKPSLTGSNRAPAKPQKPNFFERLFRVGRARKQPATTQPARSPTVTVQPPPRYAPLPQQYTSQPTYNSAPVTAAPGPRAVPARETALPESQNVLSRTTPSPAAMKPTPRTGISPPVHDDEESSSDSDSLDLDGDDQAVGSQAPQILPSQTANGPVDSPYSGLRIAPLDEEQKFQSPRSTALEGESRDGWKRSRAEPAPLEPAHDAAAVPDANPDDELETRVEADDDAGDEEHLTLPAGPKHPAEGTDSAEKPAHSKPSESTVQHPEIDEPMASTPMKGFRGYCPVALKDERKLVEALPDFESEYRGKLYTFSSAEAKTIFDMNPRKYVPAGEGTDVVRRMAGEKGVSGTLEHAAWYRGRLYLFSSAETRNTFVDSPSKYLADD